MRRRPRHGLWLASLALAVNSCAPRAAVFLDIATTTSVKNSGLLDAILPAFTPATVRVHAAGSGRALEMLSDQVVDIAITHAPAAERRYLTDHPDWQYRKFAFNRFVVVGPPEDPAGVRQAVDVVEAFRRIAASPMVFVSRSDQSGTHERERELWKASAIEPPGDRLVRSGTNMATTLRHADERQAYTLSDEAAFRQLQSQLDLVILSAGDERLLNTYAVVYSPAAPLASTFAEWLTRGEGRQRVAQHTIGGETAFVVWPDACPSEAPERRPCLSAQ